MIKYPVAYSVITDDEMTYLEGGADFLGLFNWIIGDYLRDTVKNDIRNTIWSSASQMSLEPVKTKAKSYADSNIIVKLGYLYGFYRVFDTVYSYMKKN